MSASPSQREMFQAETRRDSGIQSAIDHAEEVKKGWRRDALAVLEKFLGQRGSVEFLTEAFRVYAKQSGLIADPPDPRAWGGVMVAAKHVGLIESCGAERALTSNLSFKVLWRKKV